MNWDDAIRVGVPIGTAVLGAGLGLMIGLWIGRRNTLRGLEHQTGNDALRTLLGFKTGIGKIEAAIERSPGVVFPGGLIDEAFIRWEAFREAYVTAARYHEGLHAVDIPEGAQRRLKALKDDFRGGPVEPWKAYLGWITEQVETIRRETR